MKRRGFLSMISAAAAAPLMPHLALAQPAAAGGKGLAFARALFHSRTRYHLSVRDLAIKARVSEDHAGKLITRLLDEGHITRSKMPGTYTTATPFQPAKLPRQTQSQSQRNQAQTEAPAPHEGADLTALMTHLRRMADQYFAQAAAA